MELRQLEHFVAVVEERHFTRAAARVHIVQSSLSSSIRALERELGGALLTRGSRSVELTEAGRALLPAAYRALAAAREGREAVDAVRGLLRGELRIGMIQSFGIVEVPALLADFHRRHPAVVLRLRNNNVGSLVHATAEGELDIAFVDHPFDLGRVRAFPLGAEPLVLVAAPDHPLVGAPLVRLDALADEDFVEFRADSALRARIDAGCAEAGLSRRSCCEVDTFADLVELVRHGLGVSLLPRSTARHADRVAAIPIEPAIVRELAVVVAADRSPVPAAAALLTELGLTST
ncbi:LysR family transcriptional regulator [Pseudonocardia spinosispora]|uniref:LysR family transcriptional regulator n=1 Tax=Pseudonocardia spinosispora TaxID=103441 RepID=UPI0003FA9A9D|nr:LysR family transcriptional regulator [Pseudonocardia spinosispora]